MPATSTLPWLPCAAATPSTRLDVDTMPSLAPSTAARSQPMRPVRCRSSPAACPWTDRSADLFICAGILTSKPADRWSESCKKTL